MPVRVAGPPDAAALLELKRQLDRETSFMMFEPGERDSSAMDLAAELGQAARSQNSVVIVADAADYLAGYVEPAGQGLGTALRQARDWATAHGLHRLELTVMAHNTRAVRLYERMGFAVEGRRAECPIVDGQFIDELHMAAIIPTAPRRLGSSKRRREPITGGKDRSLSGNLAELVGIDVPTRLLIGGEWTGGHGGGTLPVIDPATEDELVQVADGTEQDALDAVAAAQDALAGWAVTPPRQRAECLRRAFELMTSRAESLARLMSAENGKALRDARAETAYAAEFFRWYAEEAVRMEGVLMCAPAGTNKILVLRQPVGVSVLVTPWNFPAAMATRKIAPALAAGCTVVLKPAPETPLTALVIAGLLAEAGVPDGVVNVLPTQKAGGVVSAMLNDPRVRKLSFTGSTEVGRILLREAAGTVVNCSMELGGNAPFVIFEDADLDAAVEGALVAKMRNGGEACTAANRFYVHEAVAEEFSRKFSARLDAMVVGPGLDESTEIGPLVNEPTRTKVAGLVESAATDGGKVVTGGWAPDRRGYFYQPTVIDQVPSGAGILSTEIFGPVAPIVRFTAEDDAVRWANDTEFGLVSYVYTRDLGRGLRVSEALETGMVGLNRGIVSDPAAPFGGVKQSGLGREGAHDGLLEFTETKYIATDW